MIKYVIFFCFFGFFSSFSQNKSIFFPKDTVFTKKIDCYSFCDPNKNLNNAFSFGELLKYRIYYGKRNQARKKLLAGHAEFYINNKNENLNNAAHYIINAKGKTTNIFSLIFSVQHYYQSIVEINSLKTIKSKMKIKEGKYKYEEPFVFFNQNQPNDLLSTFYQLRTILHEDLLLTDTICFSYLYQGKTYNSYIINHGEESIKSKFGEIKTIKLEPYLEKGRLFKHSLGAFLWVSADKMHIPIKLEIPVLVGSVYINLVKAENTLIKINK
ncbi:MAG: hypothetical protein CMP65_01660 [Flavobacteriales bacterium]|nr:hypothetical protein [Flavobacteriales bacterium]|tara:strand:- start:10248 stop:11057 length:810 start_codon:yes stop_codon:yes gene_type:complete